MKVRALTETAHRRITMPILLALTLATVLAFSAVWVWTGTATYRVATAPTPSDVFFTARTEGRLGGQVNFDGTACFWLGEGSHGRALLWPYGFRARGSRLILAESIASVAPIGGLAVYDANGRRVAEVGQYVVMGGGRLHDDVRSIVGCSGFSEFWGVGKLVSAT
jgi:hypothetical protein